MKAKRLRNISLLISIIGSLASLIGFSIILTQLLGFGKELTISLLSILISFLVGTFSVYFARAAKKLLRSRRIFLSYPHENKDLALKISEVLRKAGAKVWVDVEQVQPGESITLSIEKAISDSDTFVALLSGKPKPNLLYELGLAKAKGLKVIPVVFEHAELPTDLNDYYYIDLSTNMEEGFERLVKATT